MVLPLPSSSGPLWPVSVKAIVRTADRVLLARNDREEWELLGGRLEADEDPKQTAAREVAEESGLVVEPRELVDVWVYPVDQRATLNVLIVAYDCPVPSAVEPTVSDEHNEVRWFTFDALPTLVLPIGYRRAIELAVGRDSGRP